MSYQEAIADKVRIGKDRMGFKAYYPPCHICGKEVMSWSYIPRIVYTCKNCKENVGDIDDLLSVDMRKEEKMKKLDNALLRISKITDLGKYESGIAWVKENLGKAQWFESAEEIMVALELIKRGITAHHQVKINKYRVDFVLPDEKVILEIDGKIFHRKDTREKEKLRDGIIILAMGSEWEVIRISTEYINQNVTKLYSAIKAIKRDRKYKRLENKGALPKGYSDTAT